MALPNPGSDQSVFVLQQIFGDIIPYISGVQTSGNGVTLVSQVIYYFNVGLLMALFALFAIIIVIGTLNTAVEGEFLGRKWSSLWMVVRTTFSPLLMVPVKYGFCFAQIFVLYLVLGGVSLANYVWNMSLDVIDGGTVPAVPISLLNDVKIDVAQSVLDKATIHVQNDYGLSTQDLYPVTLSENQSPDGSSYKTCDLEVGQITNSFYQNNGQAIMCVNSSSQYPTSILPQLTSYSSQICDANTITQFYFSTSYLYGSDGYPGYDKNYNSGGKPYIPILSPVQDYLLPFNQYSLEGECQTAINNSLTRNSTTNNTFLYNFYVNNLSDIQSIGFNVSVGPTQDNNTNNNISSLVATDGYIGFTQNNINYSTSSTPNKYSVQADSASTAIVEQLLHNNVSGANNTLNNYLGELNNSLLDQVTTTSNSAQNVANQSAVNGDGEAYYDACKSYLPSDGSLTTRYLECLELNESNQTYNLMTYNTNENSQSLQPYANYINSWWIGGESYISIDKILNMNLETAASILQENLAYPNLSITSQLHYTIPISVNMYPLINGAVIPSYNVLYGDTTKTNNSGNVVSDGNSVTADTLTSTTMSMNSGITQVTNTVPDSLQSTSNNWTNLVYTYVPVPNNASQCSDQSNQNTAECQYQTAVIQLQNSLLSLPSSLRETFIYLFNLFGNNTTGSIYTLDRSHMSDIELLNNTLLFLQQNNVYQSTNTTAVPVYAVIDKIFGKIGGNNAQTDMTSIMNELYSLGLPSNGVFSTIMQAQQVGADIIQSVLDTLNSIYLNYQAQYKNLQSTTNTMIRNWTIYSGAAALGLGASTAGSVVAIMGQTAVQLYMAAQIGNLAMSLAWMPIAIVILTALFSVGITLVMMMPLIPYFLFWAGSIIWILSILEACVAGPIVALGILFPEGHEIMGHASTSIKIILNVIFRPVFMIIGITCAIALTYVLITYSAQGFHLVAPLILGNFSSSSMVQSIVSCFLIFTYASFLMMAFHKCFSVIYLLPDKVFEWVGASTGQQRAGAEEVQQLQSKTDSAAHQTGQAMGQGENQSIQAEQTKTQSTVDARTNKIQVGEKIGEAPASVASSVAGTQA